MVLGRHAGFTSVFLVATNYSSSAVHTNFTVNWRKQIETVLCAAFVLAGVVAATIRILALVVPSVEFKTKMVGNPASEPTLANRLNTTSLAKAPPRRVSQSSPFEIISPGDEGSLWDEGPVYDLSR